MNRLAGFVCVASALGAVAFALASQRAVAQARIAQATSVAAPSNSRGVEQERLDRLRRGVNVSHWFAQVYDPKGYTESHLNGFVNAADLDLIRDLGFTFVRLSVDPKVASGPHESKQLDAAIEAMLARDLAVVVDLHPHPDFNRRLAAEPAHAEALVTLWSSLAARLSKHDPNRVFLELLNEPMLDDRERWANIQRDLADAARKAAPEHTFIATGARWSSIDDLVALEPLADPNVVYNFHFYEPGTFTHQGATWAYEPWKYCKNVPYPGTSEGVAPLVATMTNEQAKSHLAQYGRDRWDAARVAKEIGRAAAWARRHDVPLICDEFGVYKQFAPPADRAAWIRDARAAFERHGIGWAMWDYAGGFALVNREDGLPVPDPSIVEALGLGASAARGAAAPGAGSSNRK